MRKNNGLTDDEVEREIETLRDSPYVKLAMKEQRLRYKRRQYLYTLRYYEKKGKDLEADGVTMDILDGMEKEADRVRDASDYPEYSVGGQDG